MIRLEDVVAEIQALNDVATAFQDTDTATAEEWSPEWMALQSIQARQIELQDLRRILEGESDVELSLSGGAEHQSKIEVGFVAKFLDSFQDTVAAVVQALTTGATERGAIPAAVVSASQMRLAASAPGSFIVRIDGPERFANVPIVGDDDEPLPEFDAAIARVMDVFDSAFHDIAGEELRNSIIELGGKRASSHFKNLAQIVGRSGTTTELIHRSDFLEAPRTARLTAETAERLFGLLSETEQMTTVEVILGKLTGVRWKNQTFDLEVEAEPPETVHGSVVTAIRDQIKNLFDRPVRAEVEITTTTTQVTEQPTVSYRLVDVRPI